MTVVTIEEAKQRMEELARLATKGEQVRITQGEMPALALIPVPAPTGKRVFGAWAGQIEIKDSFDDPMPDDWLDAFYNGSVFPDDSDADSSPAGSEPK